MVFWQKWPTKLLGEAAEWKHDFVGEEQAPWQGQKTCTHVALQHLPRQLVSPHNSNTRRDFANIYFLTKIQLDSERKQSPLSKVSIPPPPFMMSSLVGPRMLVNMKAIWLLPSIYGLLLWDGLNCRRHLFFSFLVSIKPRHSWSEMPLLFLFPLYSVTSLGLRHALCI